MRQPDTLISPGDVAALSISPHAQPYVITLVGLLAPGGFVDEAGVPDVERLRRELASQIAASPELTQRAVQRDGAWWWVGGSIDLAEHIVVDPRRADETHFGATCGRLAMTPLDPERPLWQLTLVPSARAGHCGLVLRIHHMLVDGARVTAVLERLFADGDISPAPAAPPADARPTIGERSRFRLRTLIRPRIRSRGLLGSLGMTRDVAAASVELGALESGAAAWGGTINDAYLVAVGQGVRHLIERGGERAPATIAISVPVQIPATEGTRNAVGFMLVDVPITMALPDAVRRVARQTLSAKRVARDAGPTFRAPWVARWFNWYGRRQRVIGTIASNVRGPRDQLHVAGAALVEIWPLGPLAGNLRMGFTAASYEDRFWVGIEVDASHTPPAAEVAAQVQDALQRIADRKS